MKAKVHEYIFDTWGDEYATIHAIARYKVYAGCPGDDLTPPTNHEIDILEFIYRIERYRMPPLEVPANDYHIESIDVDSIEDSIYDEHFG
jgi:hypothetical protein